MIDYIKGTLEDMNTTEAIIEAYGVGYRTLISLQTYGALNGKKKEKMR